MSTLLDHAYLVNKMQKETLSNGVVFSSVVQASKLPFKILNKGISLMAQLFSEQETVRYNRMRNGPPAFPPIRGLA